MTTDGETTTQTPSPTPPATTLNLQTVAAFRAIAMVLATKVHCFALLLSAMLVGWTVVADPTPARLIAGAGYGVFILAALMVIGRK